MKKVKRVLAVIGVILLIGLYLSTLILAIFEHSNTMNLFMASAAATVIIPVLIWTYSMIYRLIKERREEQMVNMPDTQVLGDDNNDSK